MNSHILEFINIDPYNKLYNHHKAKTLTDVLLVNYRNITVQSVTYLT